MKVGWFRQDKQKRPFTTYLKLGGGRYRIHIIPKGTGKQCGLKREMITVSREDIISFPEDEY
jgi:hypothetical protein